MPLYVLDKRGNNNNVHELHVSDYSADFTDHGCPLKPPQGRGLSYGRHRSARTPLYNARILLRDWLVEGCPECCPETIGDHGHHHAARLVDRRREWRQRHQQQQGP